MSPPRIAALIGTVLVSLGVVVGASLCFRPYVLGSDSMADTLLPGDHALVETLDARLGREPRFGDIVAHRYPLNPTQVYCKRIVGVPGDRLRIVDKQLIRNGAAVAEPYAKHVSSFIDSYRDNLPAIPKMPVSIEVVEMLRDHVQAGELVVPPGKYFVLGDNRDDSSDSRYWGFISKGDIVGRPFLVYISIAQDPRQSPPTTKIRWERFFKRL
jgi:signal peptidase I